jgi:hypothetical protein
MKISVLLKVLGICCQRQWNTDAGEKGPNRKVKDDGTLIAADAR